MWKWFYGVNNNIWNFDCINVEMQYIYLWFQQTENSCQLPLISRRPRVACISSPALESFAQMITVLLSTVLDESKSMVCMVDFKYICSNESKILWHSSWLKGAIAEIMLQNNIWFKKINAVKHSYNRYLCNVLWTLRCQWKMTYANKIRTIICYWFQDG